jgi:hypothetical protein
MTSDTDFVIAILRRGPASTNTILAESFAERKVGLTVHSRISDARRVLERAGETITCRTGGQTRAGRTEYVYEIVALVPVQLGLLEATA